MVVAGPVVCGVTLRGIGRGFGKGTANDSALSNAATPAPSISARKRRERAGTNTSFEAFSRVTAALRGESGGCFIKWFSSLKLWTKQQMC